MIRSVVHYVCERMYAFRFGWVVFACSMAGCTHAKPALPANPATDSRPSATAKIHVAASAKQMYEQLERLEVTGSVILNSVFVERMARWSMDLRDATLDAAAKDQERREAIEAHVRRMKRLQRRVEQLVKGAEEPDPLLLPVMNYFVAEGESLAGKEGTHVESRAGREEAGTERDNGFTRELGE